jgi:hypothetical protein
MAAERRYSDILMMRDFSFSIASRSLSIAGDPRAGGDDVRADMMIREEGRTLRRGWSRDQEAGTEGKGRKKPEQPRW